MSNNSQDEIDILGPTVAFKSAFLAVDGEPSTALLLSQIYHYQKRADAGDTDFGVQLDNEQMWFWKTQDAFQRVTGLSAYHQRKARESLREMPWYSEQKKGMPAKTFYHLDRKNLKIWAAAKDPDIPLDPKALETEGEGAGSKDPKGLESGSKGFGNKESNPSESNAPEHNTPATRSKTTSKSTTKTTSESSAERAPTPEQSAPDTSPTLRDLVSRKLGAKAHQLNAPLTDEDITRITERIDDSKVPESAYEHYLQTEATRIRSISGLRDWPGGDKSVDRYLDNHPDVTPDVPEAKRRNSSNGRRARHWDDDLDQDLIDQIERNQGGYKRDRNGEEVA